MRNGSASGATSTSRVPPCMRATMTSAAASPPADRAGAIGVASAGTSCASGFAPCHAMRGESAGVPSARAERTSCRLARQLDRLGRLAVLGAHVTMHATARFDANAVGRAVVAYPPRAALEPDLAMTAARVHAVDDDIALGVLADAVAPARHDAVELHLQRAGGVLHREHAAIRGERCLRRGSTTRLARDIACATGVLVRVAEMRTHGTGVHDAARRDIDFAGPAADQRHLVGPHVGVGLDALQLRHQLAIGIVRGFRLLMLCIEAAEQREIERTCVAQSRDDIPREVLLDLLGTELGHEPREELLVLLAVLAFDVDRGQQIAVALGDGEVKRELACDEALEGLANRVDQHGVAAEVCGVASASARSPMQARLARIVPRRRRLRRAKAPRACDRRIPCARSGSPCPVPIFSASCSAPIGDDQRGERPSAPHVPHARCQRQAIALRKPFQEVAPRAAGSLSPDATRSCSAGSDSSISTAMRGDVAHLHDARAATCPRASARQRANEPSNVHTSGRRECVARRLVRGGSRVVHGAALHGQRADVATRDLHRDLRRGIGSVIAGAVDAARARDPVALGQHRDHLGPARLVGRSAIRGDVPLVGPQRRARRALLLRMRRVRSAKALQVVERAIVVRKRGRPGLAGDPVDLADSARVEDLLAREREVPARCLNESPLRITPAAAWLIALSIDSRRRRRNADVSVACAAVPVPRTCSTRCGSGDGVSPLAAAASVAIMPATPSAVARAWPWPQPSATTSTTSHRGTSPNRRCCRARRRGPPRTAARARCRAWRTAGRGMVHRARQPTGSTISRP